MTFTFKNFTRLVYALYDHINSLQDVNERVAFCGYRNANDFSQALPSRYIAVAIYNHYMAGRSEKIFIKFPRRYYPAMLNNKGEIQEFIKTFIFKV